MAYVLSAPYDAPKTAIILRNPKFGDQKNIQSEADYKRSLNGTIYTYRKTIPEMILTLSFDMTWAKFRELQEFVTLYCTYTIKLSDYNRNELWKVKILNPELTYVIDHRGWTIENCPNREGESGTVQMDLLGYKVSDNV